MGRRLILSDYEVPSYSGASQSWSAIVVFSPVPLRESYSGLLAPLFNGVLSDVKLTNLD